MSERRLFLNDPNSKISEEEARDKPHFRLIFDSEGRVSICESFDTGSRKLNRTEYEYHDGELIRHFFNPDGSYRGKMEVKELRDGRARVVSYDSGNEITDVIEGIHGSLVQNGEFC